jgi:hypothetical protein
MMMTNKPSHTKNDQRRPIEQASLSQSKKTSSRNNGKSSNPDYTQTTFYLPKELHKHLKVIAAEQDRDMSSIVEEILNSWIESESFAES